MTEAGVDPVDRLFDTVRGNQWVKVALQVNPWPYLVHQGATEAFKNADDFNAQMAASAQAAGIGLVAITDHHNADDAGLSDAFRAAGILVLPGIEITAASGTHILAIFPEDSDTKEIEAIAVRCGRRVGSLDDGDGVTIPQVIEHAARAGAIPIAPHILYPTSGVLAGVAGQERVKAWTHPLLRAGCLDRDEPTDATHLKIVENRDGATRRDRPLPLINSADVTAPADFGKRSTHTFLAMTQPSFQGLEIALEDPESRVHRPTAGAPVPLLHVGPRIVGVHWDGGTLDGLLLPFHDGLNTLIGGRGTGKSTVVESLRHALGLDGLSGRSREVTQSLIGDVIGPNTTIAVAIRDDPDRYVVRRTGHEAIEVTRNGIVDSVMPATLLPELRILGQHESAELSRDGAVRVQLLDPYLPPDSELQGAQRELIGLRPILDRARQDLEHLDEQARELDQLSTELERLESQGVEELVKQVADLDAVEDGLNATRERYSQWDKELAKVRDDLTGCAQALHDDHVGNSSRSGPLQALRQSLATTDAEITASLDVARSKAAERLTTLDEELATTVQLRKESDAALRKALKSRDTSTQQSVEIYRAKKRRQKELQTVPAQRSKAKEELDGLQQRWDRSLSHRDDALVTRRQALVAGTATFQQALARGIRASHDGSSEPRLRLRARTITNAEGLTTCLRSNAGGNLSTTESALRERAAADRARDRPPITGGDIAVARTAAKIRDLLQTTEAQGKRIADALTTDPGFAEELQTVLPVEVVTVELHLGEAGFRPIEQLSIGQQATAVLLMLLAAKSGPVVIDQPEDDLDNEFVVTSVVPLLRHAKREQQYILSTHNANIPVLGDADQILGMSWDARRDPHRITVSEKGALDVTEVRDRVATVLEGGRAALDERKRRYG